MKLKLLIAVLGVAAMLSAGLTPAFAAAPIDPAVLTPVTRELGLTPTDALAADVIGGAKQDLVVSSALSVWPGSGGQVLVYQQNPNGVLATTPVTLDVADDDPSLDLAAADFDDDGDPDLAVAGEQDIQIFLRGAGGLPTTASATYPTSAGERPSSLVVADLNDDGRDDLAFVTQTTDDGNDVWGRLQLAGGGFGAASWLLSIQDQEIVAGDVNNDGRDDLVLKTGTPPVTALLQAADHSFSTSSIAFDGVILTGLLVTDVTGDGLTDLVGLTAVPQSTVSILAGAAGTLPSPDTSVDLPDDTSGLVAADLNGDGTTDLATGGENRPWTFGVLQADDGSFATTCGYALRGDLQAAANVTGGLWPDLITTSQYLNGSVNVFPLEAPASQMVTDVTVDSAPSDARIGDELFLRGYVSFQQGGCVDPGASVEIIQTLPGGSPQVIDTVTLDAPTGTIAYFSATEIAPTVEGTVEYSARFVGDTLHASSESGARQVAITKRDSVLVLKADDKMITFGKKTTLRAHLTGGVNRTVIFYRGEGADRVEIDRVDADDAGTASLRVTPTRKTVYSAAYEGDDTAYPAESLTRQVEVEALVEGAMKRFDSRSGKYAIYRPTKKVFYAASVKPRKAGDKVRISFEYYQGGHWRSSGSQAFHLGAKSTVTIYLLAKDLPVGMPFRLYTSWRGDRENLGASSAYDYFKVKR